MKAVDEVEDLGGVVGGEIAQGLLEVEKLGEAGQEFAEVLEGFGGFVRGGF